MAGVKRLEVLLSPTLTPRTPSQACEECERYADSLYVLNEGGLAGFTTVEERRRRVLDVSVSCSETLQSVHGAKKMSSACNSSDNVKVDTAQCQPCGSVGARKAIDGEESSCFKSRARAACRLQLEPELMQHRIVRSYSIVIWEAAVRCREKTARRWVVDLHALFARSLVVVYDPYGRIALT